MSLTRPHIALIDADLWTYDIPFAAQRKQEGGKEVILSFDYCKEFVDLRYEEIMRKLKCTEAEFYLTGEGNFRHDVATTLPYKGNRSQPRPFHYNNVRNYIAFAFNTTVINGMEADDMLSIRQKELGDTSVIVSRDKDLRMVKGWHYSYAVGNQKEKDLEYIDRVGYLMMNGKNLIGGGLKWFYAQCIMGDRTDNIQGIPKAGPKAAFNALSELTTEEELYDVTFTLYENYFGEQATQAFKENAQLVWMLESEDRSCNPVLRRIDGS